MDKNITLQSSISIISGIGEKRQKQLNKKGIETIKDLIEFFPISYKVKLPYEKSFKDASAKKAPLIIQFVSTPTYKKNKMSATVKDYYGVICYCSWFNVVSLPYSVKKGDIIIADGSYNTKGSFNYITNPILYRPKDYEEIVGSITPVYSAIEGVPNRTISKLVTTSLSYKLSLDDEIPQSIIEDKSFTSKEMAICQLHNPASQEDLNKAMYRMSFEELYSFTKKMREQSSKLQKTLNPYSFHNIDIVNQLVECLPYELTNGQKTALKQIIINLCGKYIMNRLLQGDVGSGKSIVSFISAIFVATNGYQAAIMAPTEILARQHYEDIIGLIKNANLDINVYLLVGSNTNKEKDNILKIVSKDEACIVIGTHSLSNNATKFKKLAYTVIDEQHKFGVNQRKSMSEGLTHTLLMSATPIPRTMGLILYGSTSVSEISEYPKGRIPIQNAVCTPNDFNKICNFVREQVEMGHQAYFVCPAILEDNTLGIANVEETYKKLKECLPDIKMAVVHGNTTPDEKDYAIKQFEDQDVDILIASTVVEVGVNVPNATVMCIMGADRFGLAQLHQLRGRVGRGKYASYCIFVDTLNSKASKERMKVISSTNSGFVIAKADLKYRGPGDMLGLEQSGKKIFKYADITDSHLVMDVSKYV